MRSRKGRSWAWSVGGKLAKVSKAMIRLENGLAKSSQNVARRMSEVPLKTPHSTISPEMSRVLRKRSCWAIALARQLGWEEKEKAFSYLEGPFEVGPLDHASRNSFKRSSAF
jgi:hypothetical protein